ncbi:MAG: GNAT family N-acetyltransferase [Actinomycetota bacterium]|nr:GNAT family N-acetyltransferase [Actinomycetota bacterium]
MDPIHRPGAIPAFPGLRDGHILLRDWTFEDLPCVEEASRDPFIPTGTTVPSPFSEEGGRAFVQRQWGRRASGQGLSLAITEARTDDAVGLIVLLHRQQPGVVGVGYWIVAGHRRRGFALAAVHLLSRWALGLPAVARLEALVEPGNDGSVRVLEGAGFRREGLLREYLELRSTRSDVWLYSLIRSDVQHPSG